jgi:hypothetical protein
LKHIRASDVGVVLIMGAQYGTGTIIPAMCDQIVQELAKSINVVSLKLTVLDSDAIDGGGDCAGRKDVLGQHFTLLVEIAHKPIIGVDEVRDKVRSGFFFAYHNAQPFPLVMIKVNTVLRFDTITEASVEQRLLVRFRQVGGNCGVDNISGKREIHDNMKIIDKKK